MGGFRYEALQEAPVGVHEKLFAAGVTPRYEDLAGYEFKGYNPPAFARIAGIQRFIKGFYQKAGDPPPAEAERIYGYNLFCDRKAPPGIWRALPDEERPRRHGFYDVYPAPKEGPGARYPHSLLIDYGVPENSGLNPERVIRDYLSQPDPKNPDIFIGKAYLKLGPFRIHSNFFLLERLRPHSYRP